MLQLCIIGEPNRFHAALNVGSKFGYPLDQGVEILKKAGVCPKPGIGICVVRCRNDASCPGNEKCVCYLSKISICLLFIENSS